MRVVESTGRCQVGGLVSSVRGVAFVELRRTLSLGGFGEAAKARE